MDKEHFKQLIVLVGLVRFATIDDDLSSNVLHNLGTETRKKLIHFSNQVEYLDNVEHSVLIDNFNEILNETLTKLEPYTEV